MLNVLSIIYFLQYNNSMNIWIETFLNEYRNDLYESKYKYKREKFDLFYQNLKEQNLVVIGLRQIGKSTIVKQLAQKYIEDFKLEKQHVVYFNFSDSNSLSFQDIQLYIMQNKVDLVVFDEIQQIKDWTFSCQALMDFKRKNGTKFIITGSNAKELSREIMPNRARVFWLNNLTFNEYKLFWQDDTLDRFINYGSYPKFDNYTSPETQYRQTTRSLVIKRVLSEEYGGIIDVQKFEELMSKINDVIGNIFKVRQWSLNTAARNTAAHYLTIMDDAKLIKKINKYYDKHDMSTTKIYFSDKSMINLFNNFDMLNNNLLGSLVENLVFNYFDDLYNEQYLDNNIKFYTGKNGCEIDFVIPVQKLLVEVKYHKDIDMEKIACQLEKTRGNEFENYTKIVITKYKSGFANGWYFITVEDLLSNNWFNVKDIIDSSKIKNARNG